MSLLLIMMSEVPYANPPTSRLGVSADNPTNLQVMSPSMDPGYFDPESSTQQMFQNFMIKNDHDNILGILNMDHIPALLRKEKMQNMIEKPVLKVTKTERVQDVIKKMQDDNQDIVLVCDKNKETVLGLWHHPIPVKKSTFSS